MEIEDIQAFLAAVQYGNISAAADNLYLPQSTVSKRIMNLEAELGIPLIIRSRGKRTIELTSYGKELLLLGRQGESLIKEIKALSALPDISEISIGAVDLINNYTFTDLYKDILISEPHIRLDIHTHHSAEIYSMMEAQRIDIGFTSIMLPVNNIEVTAFYSEPMLVIMAENKEKENGSVIPYADLDPALELYARWSNDFEIWHDQLWPGKKYHMHVGTGSMFPTFLDLPGRWGICPASTVKGMLRRFSFSWYILDLEIPERTFYMLKQKNPRPSRINALSIFEKKLTDYIKNRSELKYIGAL